MLVDEIPSLRKSQHEMQKQSRLQEPGDNVAPIDRPVELVELSGELEGVENE